MVRSYLKSLFVINFTVYFFVSPMVPNDRFLLPMWLVLYLLLLDFIIDVKFTKRQLMTIVLVFVIFLLIVDFGIVYPYPKGKLKLIWAYHSKEMREELKEFMVKNNLANEKFYAVNPMNAYYLNLQTEPYYTDTFGLIVLKGTNAGQILANLSKSGINYYIFSTWGYFPWISINLKSQLGNMSLTAITRHRLIYGDSYKNGEILELYKKDIINTGILRINSYKGTLQVWINETKAFRISMKDGNETYDFRTRVISLTPTDYNVIQTTKKGKEKAFNVHIDQSSLIMECSQESTIIISFSYDVAVLVHNKLLPVNQSVTSNDAEIYLPAYRIKISGANFTLLRMSSKKIPADW